MAERQHHGRRPTPPSTSQVPEEGSPRPMWLKPPPRSKQPRQTWDQIIAGAAARRAGEEGPPLAAAPAAAPSAAAEATADGAPRRRRRRRGRRGHAGVAPAPGSEGADEPQPRATRVQAPPESQVARDEAAAGADAGARPRARRRRRGRRGGSGGSERTQSGSGSEEGDGGKARAQAPSVTATAMVVAVEAAVPPAAVAPPKSGRRGRRPAEAAGSASEPLGEGVAPQAAPRRRRARGDTGAGKPTAEAGGARHRVVSLRVRAVTAEVVTTETVEPQQPAPAPLERAQTPARRRQLRGPRVPGAGEPLPPGKVRVIYRDGRELTPCDRKKAEQEVALGRAKWIGDKTIRLRYDPFRARRTRRRILERDEGVCAYCGSMGDTIDHLTPWSLGGRTTMDNCVTSCAECNFRRGNRPVIDFVAAEGITLRRLRNPVLLEYVRAARAARKAEAAPGGDQARSS